MRGVWYLFLVLLSSFGFAQVGIDTTTPHTGAILDLSSTDKALLLPRVATTSAVVTPTNGMLIYDVSSGCIKSYENGAWSSCLSSTSSSNSSVIVDCAVNGFTGNYATSFAMTTANKFSVTVTNNSFSVATITFQPSDVVLSGVSGISVSAVSLSSVTLNPGQSQLVEYALSGVPSTNGTLIGTWNKLLLNCSDTQVVAGLSTLLNDVNYCTNATLNGTFFSGVAFTASNTFEVTITNNSGSTIDSMPAPAISNLALTWTGTGTLTVTSVTPTGTYSLANGASRTFTYTLSGIPTSIGTLTANWTYNDLICQKLSNNTGGATFTLPQYNYVLSTLDGTVDIENFITNSAPNQLIINLPYANGSGSYSVYNGSVITGNAGEGGDVNGFSISYPAGTFAASGIIPVTVTVDGDGMYNVKKQLFGMQQTIVTLPVLVNGTNVGNIILKVVGGIPDKTFGQTINGANNHNFVYVPIIAADGKTWLNNNLGAHYADTNHASFNPLQQAASATDHLAYGSLFQWGRKPDGHELISWTSNITGTPVNGTTTTLSDNPDNALYILNNSTDWRTIPEDTLWATEASANNPCPTGYRVPTIVEFNTLITASSITNSATAASSVMKLSSPGSRGTAGTIIDFSTYWSSSVYLNHSLVLYLDNYNINTASFTFRSSGRTVRCIQN